MKEDRRNKVIELIEKNQISRAVSRISSCGVAELDTEEDRRKVREKYPEKKKEGRVDIVKQAPVDNFRGVVEKLTRLRKETSTVTDGLRPEYTVS